MFKKACFVVLLVLLCSTVFSVRLVDPISKDLSKDNFVGSFVPGSTLELIFSKELGKFDSLEFNSSLPKEFSVSVEDYLESIKVFISSDIKAIPSDYEFEVVLKGRTVEESVDLYFLVEKRLLDVSLNNYSVQTLVGEKAEYEFSLINNSHADAEFKIQTSLPWYWLSNPASTSMYKTIIVPKKSVVKEKLVVIPKTPGELYFTSKIIMNTSETKEFSHYLDSKPTLKSKFNSVLNGLPFYSISQLPSYFVTGLFSLLFN